MICSRCAIDLLRAQDLRDKILKAEFFCFKPERAAFKKGSETSMKEEIEVKTKGSTDMMPDISKTTETGFLEPFEISTKVSRITTEPSTANISLQTFQRISCNDQSKQAPTSDGKHDQKKLTCDHCNSAFRNKYLLRNHIQEIHLTTKHSRFNQRHLIQKPTGSSSHPRSKKGIKGFSDVKINIHDQAYKLPFKYGWKRELVSFYRSFHSIYVH